MHLGAGNPSFARRGIFDRVKISFVIANIHMIDGMRVRS